MNNSVACMHFVNNIVNNAACSAIITIVLDHVARGIFLMRVMKTFMV